MGEKGKRDMSRRYLSAVVAGLLALIASPAFAHCGRCHEHHERCDACGSKYHAWGIHHHDHGYANVLYYTGDFIYTPVGFVGDAVRGG